MFPKLLLMSVLAGMLPLYGCSQRGGDLPRAAVHGTVKLDGRPLTKGVIRFVPIDDSTGPRTSVMVDAGMFAAEGIEAPVVGKHRIEIESADDGGYALDDETAIERLKQSGVKMIEAVQIPSIYNTRSELQETVTQEGPNEFHFDLKTPPALSGR